MQYDNGVPASQITGVAWFKSSASTAQGNCVEVAALSEGVVAVRNSRYPDGPALLFTPGEIEAFVDGAKACEFDRLTCVGQA
ncbi:DUF397 domain-containing protein [Streptomyces sp. NPDC094034]|uniref:DUF397 domain-containing protein n=1 Tax=Streptomyces sp. NPDC094034 TaxID=3155309 RepID=UPI003325C9B5